MSYRRRPKVGIAGVLYLLLGFALLGFAVSVQVRSQSRTPDNNLKEARMSARASGTFDVKLNPIVPDDSSVDSNLGRMSIAKQFHGDLEATGKGQMLTAMTTTKGSAGYVAIERVSGNLHGRSGTFVLQHSGMMNRGEQWQRITVVPDSGTDELMGLSGEMTIMITEGKHSYEFNYTLTPDP